MAERYRSATLPGLARAFRRWAATIDDGPLVNVSGATLQERHRLALLGGLAAAIAGGALDTWQEPLRTWALNSPIPPADILDATRTALGRDDDPLATLYNASISAANRRRLGTVFSPPALVEHMMRLVEVELREPPAVVIDPGAGVGAFTIAAARTWPSSQIVAVDVNPVTLGLLGARLAFEADLDPHGGSLYRSVELRLASYLDELEGYLADSQPSPVLILGNPPYTRLQELASTERAKAAALAGGFIDSGHANLAILFQAATLRHMRPNDVSCMVLPGSLSYTRASRALRTALWQSPRPITVHRTPATDKAFVGRSVQAAVLMIGSVRQRRPKLRLGRIQLNDVAVNVLESWTLSRTGEPPENWFWAGDTFTNAEVHLALGDVAIVRRGTATGANSVFFLTDADRDGLPTTVVTVAVPSLRRFSADELTEATHANMGDESTRRWLLAIPPEMELNDRLAEYLERHREAVSQRHLVARRTPWYAIVELPRPQILVSPLSKTDFKIVLNTVRAVPSNNLFGITLRNDQDPRALADWLRSSLGQEELRRLSHRYPGGSHKLEPGRLRAVRLPRSVITKLRK